MARKRPMRNRPMRWRHIPGTIWGERRAELWRGDDLFATVKPGSRHGSSWWVGGVNGEIHRVPWSAATVEESKAAAKAYVKRLLGEAEPGDPSVENEDMEPAGFFEPEEPTP